MIEHMHPTIVRLFGEKPGCPEIAPGTTDRQCDHWKGHGGCCTSYARGESGVTMRWVVPGRVETWMNKPEFRQK